MEKNVGNYEAIVRGVLGATGLALAIGQRNPLWLIVAAAGFGTAFTQYCPVSAALGINTYSPEQQELGEPEKTAPTIH